MFYVPRRVCVVGRVVATMSVDSTIYLKILCSVALCRVLCSWCYEDRSGVVGTVVPLWGMWWRCPCPQVDKFLANEAAGTKVVGAKSLQDMVAKLKKPRRVMLLVKGGWRGGGNKRYVVTLLLEQGCMQVLLRCYALSCPAITWRCVLQRCATVASCARQDTHRCPFMSYQLWCSFYLYCNLKRLVRVVCC